MHNHTDHQTVYNCSQTESYIYPRNANHDHSNTAQFIHGDMPDLTQIHNSMATNSGSFQDPEQHYQLDYNPKYQIQSQQQRSLEQAEARNENRIQKNQIQRASRLRDLAEQVRRQARMLNQQRHSLGSQESAMLVDSTGGSEPNGWEPIRARMASISTPAAHPNAHSVYESLEAPEARHFIRSTSFSSTGSRAQTSASLSQASSGQLASQTDDWHSGNNLTMTDRHQGQQPMAAQGGWSPTSVNPNYSPRSTANQLHSSMSLSPSDALNLGINLEQYISKRNERERSRVKTVNDAFDHLRNSLPIDIGKLTKRVSKVEILRTAINYIRSLEEVLGYIKPKSQIERCNPQELHQPDCNEYGLKRRGSLNEYLLQ